MPSKRKKSGFEPQGSGGEPLVGKVAYNTVCGVMFTESQSLF